MIIKPKDNPKKLNIFLVTAAVVFFLIASSVVPFLSSAKGMRAPDVMLCFVCCLPFFANMKKAAIFAVVTGFFTDLFITSPVSLSPLVFLVCICVVPLVARLFSRTGTLVIAFCTLPCILLRAVVTIVLTLITVDGATFAKAVSDYSPLTVAIDFACAICVAFIMRLVSKRLKMQSYT